MARHLRLAGASREVIKIAKGLQCQTCSRCQRAKPAKTGHLLRFNELIGADLFYVHDINNVKHELLSVVDHSSGYHVVLPLTKKDTATLEKALCDGWLHVFGVPDSISIDLETGLQKALARLGDWLGFKVRSAAGQAHWQAGYTERQGALWKNMFQRVCEEKSVDKSDMPAAIAAISHAKNSLRKVSGFSPRQHVFGSDGALPEDLVDGPHAHDPLDTVVMDDKHAREVAIRTAARAAYHHVQTDDQVRRALAGRARVQARIPNIGERVFFYRLARNNKRGTWQGPGVVIGREQENIWVSKGGRCLLCAPEHVRLATNEELGEMFTLRASQVDLERLLNADQEDEEVFVDNRPHRGGQVDKDDGPDFAEDMFVDEDEGDAPIELVEEDADDEADDHLALDDGEPGYRPVRARDQRPRPGPLRRHRRKGPEYYTEAVHEAWMLKKAKTKRSLEKQLEKEIPWRLIPADKREAFQEAESKQWAEHLDHKAIEVLDVATSRAICERVDPRRILPSRYAYKDKNLGRRRVDPTVPWRPKARLVVGGHVDPDVDEVKKYSDSPTVSRTALMLVLQIATSRQWQAAAGDVQAAFLNGLELKRELWKFSGNWCLEMIWCLGSSVLSPLPMRDAGACVSQHIYLRDMGRFACTVTAADVGIKSHAVFTNNSCRGATPKKIRAWKKHLYSIYIYISI